MGAALGSNGWTGELSAVRGWMDAGDANLHTSAVVRGAEVVWADVSLTLAVSR
jgi:hypothetical protein